VVQQGMTPSAKQVTQTHQFLPSHTGMWEMMLAVEIQIAVFRIMSGARSVLPPSSGRSQEDQYPDRDRNCSLFHQIQVSFWDHTVSSPMDTRGFSPCMWRWPFVFPANIGVYGTYCTEDRLYLMGFHIFQMPLAAWRHHHTTSVPHKRTIYIQYLSFIIVAMFFSYLFGHCQAIYKNAPHLLLQINMYIFTNILQC
jgi:hypothetical protein